MKPIPEGYRFSNKDLRKLIIPLIIEQFLQISIGLVDSIMVASLGEAAVSGVSLVDSVFVLLIYVFSALATGGAVVTGHYIGRKDQARACKAAWQMLLFITLLSVAVTVLCYIGRNLILDHIFGDIEADVRYNSWIFLIIVSASIPFMALYNAGAAIFRIMGNSKISMKISLLMNVLNISGISIMIYGFHMAVEGAAIPTLLARVVAAIVIIKMLFDKKLEVHVPRPLSFQLDKGMLKQIFRIAVPNGMESGMFHLGKLLVMSLVSSFGTAAIAANAVGNYVNLFAVLPGVAIGLAITTVVSQCVGAGDYQQVRYYTKKLMKLTYLLLVIFNVVIILAVPLILHIYGLSEEASRFARQILIYTCICHMLIWPLSFPLGNMLRAADDVAYTMIVSVISMWVFRVGFSYLLGAYLGMGVFGVWVAMTIDWLCRSILFIVRHRNGKWERAYRLKDV